MWESIRQGRENMVGKEVREGEMEDVRGRKWQGVMGREKKRQKTDRKLTDRQIN